MLIGIDYASVDGNGLPRLNIASDACKAARSTLSFAFIRGSYGTTADRTWGRDALTLERYGLTVGAYAFLRMPRRGGPIMAAPADQMRVFADNVGTLTKKHFPPALDVEDSGLSGQAELDWVHEAWSTLKSIYGVAPRIYTSQRVWIEDLHNLPAGEMTESPLWLAKPWPWPVRSKAQLDDSAFKGGQRDPGVPLPWGQANWWIHQYQGDAFPMPGFSNTVDLSRFRLMVQGETGERVKWVQRRLGIIDDGVFGPGMASHLRMFQKTCQLVEDAVIGPKTFAAIAWQAGVEAPAPRCGA